MKKYYRIWDKRLNCYIKLPIFNAIIPKLILVVPFLRGMLFLCYTVNKKEEMGLRDGACLKFIIQELEKQRSKSIDNFSKSDIYSKDDIYEIIKWFELVIEKVKNKPPRDYISKLIIFEDIKNKDMTITYVYNNNGNVNENKFEIVIKN